MKNTLNTSEAASLLMADENAAWTMAGAYSLAEYLEQYEEDCGTEIEFDRVALRCEYSEYESLQEWAQFFLSRQELADGYFSEEDENHEENIRDYIRDRGQLIEFDGGIIVSEF
jgi:hypothetical protein